MNVPSEWVPCVWIIVAVLDLSVTETGLTAIILSGSLPTDRKAFLHHIPQNEQRKVADSRVTFTD